MRVAIVACILLTACSTPQMRSEARMDGAARMCANAGMAPGTNAYADCVQTVYANETQADAQRRAAMFKAGIEMMKPPPGPPPPVNCRYWPPGSGNVVCQ